MIFWRAAGGFFWQFIDRFPFRNSHFGVPESENFPAAGGGQNFGSRVRLLKTKGGDNELGGTMSYNSTDGRPHQCDISGNYLRKLDLQLKGFLSLNLVL